MVGLAQLVQAARLHDSCAAAKPDPHWGRGIVVSRTNTRGVRALAEHSPGVWRDYLLNHIAKYQVERLLCSESLVHSRIFTPLLH